MSYRGYREPKATAVWVLIGIDLFLFVVGLAFPDLEFILGLSLADVSVRPWTLVTNMFVHGGFSHILGNMLTLYFFGSSLCALVGERRFLYVYFVGGLMGNIFYLLAAALLLRSPFSVAIGASGAIFAVGGALTVMRPMQSVIIFPLPAPIPLWVAVIGGFIVMSFFPGVAWEAHLGGLLFGLAAGYFFRQRELRGRLPF